MFTRFQAVMYCAVLWSVIYTYFNCLLESGIYFLPKFIYLDLYNWNFISQEVFCTIVL